MIDLRDHCCRLQAGQPPTNDPERDHFTMSNPPIWLSSDEIQERLHIIEAAVEALFRTHPDPASLRVEWDKTVSGLKDRAERAATPSPGATLSDVDQRTADTFSTRFRIADGYRSYIGK
ncbi:hypothetical protein AAB988_31810 [Burkholderia contaminans]|uniref:hypothetical protein n=1 Tax=Burkholderia contaminans TaxID=488447 RepID=UPI00310F4396